MQVAAPVEPTPPRMVELEIIDRYSVEGRDGNTANGVEEGVENAAGVESPKAQKITLKVDASGVEIIESSADENVTKIPLHLVNLSDPQKAKSVYHAESNSVAVEEKDKNGSGSSSLQGHQQILPPIEVGLQLGHPQETTTVEKATPLLQDCEAQTDLVEAVNAEASEATAIIPEAAVKESREVQTEPVEVVAPAAEAAPQTAENNVLEAEKERGHEAAAAEASAVATSETSSQTDLTYHQLEEAREASTVEADSEVAVSENLTRSEIQIVTSETQTVTVDQKEFATQTEASEAEEEVQQQPLQPQEPPEPPKELVEAGVQTEEVETEEEPVETRGERPPTLPGSSIDLPAEEHLEVVDPPDFNFYRTRTVSPLNLRVQDDVVARVLLEHVGTVFPAPDPRLRSGVNYLDLSRLGDEGETPASDEIWLAVDGSGHSEDEGAEDKFLTTDDTETYSINTDKLSVANTMMDGQTGPTLLAPNSANLLSEQELADLGGCESFDAEAEATARLQGVLASELVPLTNTVQTTEKHVLGLSTKFGSMETIITGLCNTINTLQNQIVPPKSDDGISIRRVSNGQVKTEKKSPSPPPAGGVKKGEIALLDQLVARIEHLSTDVANMDASRQLREDNLLLRKELQTYREREIQMMSRLETLERRVTEYDTGPPRQSRRGHRSRRSSVASSRGTPELPPIEPRSKSVDPNKEVKKEPAADTNGEMPRLSSGNEESKSPPPTTKEDPKLDKIQVKQPLISQSKISKRGVPKLRRPSNSNSNSSGSESDQGQQNVKILSKRQPITPKLDTDSLQTEIQIVRSDNSILRNDIQVFRERERQLYSRNQNLQEQLVVALSPRPGSGDRKKHREDKSEVNINVDFVTDEQTGGPKAVFDAKTKKKGRDGSSTPPKRDSSKDRSSSGESNKRQESKESKDRKPLKKAPSKENLKKAPSKENLMKKAPSKENIAVPKKKNGSKKSSSSGSESDKVEAGPPIEEEKSVKINAPAANGVPKTKTAQKSKNGTAKTAKNGSKKPSPKTSSSDEGKEKLLEDEQWKVTISSKHELETTSDDNEKTVTVKPRAVEQVTAEVKEEAKAVKKAKKAAKIEKTKEKKDPIPKPSMYPAARPPRGYVPPPARVNESPGVTRALMGPEAPMLFHGSPMMMDKPLIGPPPRTPRSGRASSVDSMDGDREYSMVIKQEPRDSLVDAAPPRTPRTPTRRIMPPTPHHPPICQVSYDSVYDDPYYSMSYY